MIQDPIIPIILVACALFILCVILIAKMWRKRSSGPTTEEASAIPAGITLEAQPLMTKTEALFYNVLRIAAQDNYLIFPQIPLWCAVDVKAAASKTRQAFLLQIALKRLDFVLVHPGTLTIVKAVELEVETHSSTLREARNRLVDEIAKMAGIELVRLVAQSYTVPEITALLDLEPLD